MEGMAVRRWGTVKECSGRVLLEAMMGCELAPSKDVLGVGTPTLNFMEQWSREMPVVQVGGDAAELVHGRIMAGRCLSCASDRAGEERESRRDPEVTASGNMGFHSCRCHQKQVFRSQSGRRALKGDCRPVQGGPGERSHR
jgi:hypothetical protein